MNRLLIIVLVGLMSCTQPDKQIIEVEESTINIDSLADATIQQVNKQKKQKVLPEQELWRKKREINKSLIFNISPKKHINTRYLNLTLNNNLLNI